MATANDDDMTPEVEEEPIITGDSGDEDTATVQYTIGELDAIDDGSVGEEDKVDLSEYEEMESSTEDDDVKARTQLMRSGGDSEADTLSGGSGDRDEWLDQKNFDPDEDWAYDD